MAFISRHVIKKVGAIKKKKCFPNLDCLLQETRKKPTKTKGKKKKQTTKNLITELLQIILDYIFKIT